MQSLIRLSDRRRRRGAVLVWTAIVLIVLVGFVGLAVDFGYAYYTGQKLQNAADAAALAGAHQVWYGHDDARAAAITIAAANEAGGASVQLADNPDNVADGDVVVGIYDATERTFTPSSDFEKANAVRAVARRTSTAPGGPLGLFFGAIFGQPSVDISRWGIAVAEGGPAYSDLIALNESDPYAFYIHGHGYLDLGDGEAQVNSSNTAAAAMFQGTNITYIFGETNVVGRYDERGNNQVLDWNNVFEGEDVESDPLADLPEPDPVDYDLYQTEITGGSTEAPAQFYSGYYPNGIDLKDGDSVFLNPGVYILDNGFEINGRGTLTGYGVMIFLRTGSIKDNGTGQVYLTPPTSGVYENIQFFQARDNTETAEFNGGTIWDGAAVDDPNTPDVDESTAGTGTLYFPSAAVELGGTGDMWVDGLIADTVQVYGTGRKTVTGGWDSDEGTEKVYIVE